MDYKASGRIVNDAYWFIFCNDELLIKETEDTINILVTCDTKLLEPTDVQSIGKFHGSECYIATIKNNNIPEGFSFKKVRPLYGHIEDEYFWLACRASHISNWMKNNKFCGCCGGVMNVSSQELAMQCINCSHIVYPRISPAIIVAVIRDGQILLAHSTRFPPNRYSVIAGFVEPGETLEECVRRELKEEVGIEVDTINYFASQPWPFPDSLMVAFTAQCSTEKITIDNQEILAAGWFSPHNLPNIPENPSVSRQLIDWFVEKYK